MNLYQIANNYQSILSQTFDAETGEVNEHSFKLLDSAANDMEEKGIAVASYIKNLEAERDAINLAKRAMTDREARLNRKLDYMTEYLKSNMERCGITSISSPYFEVKIKNNPESVYIIDEESLEPNFFNEKVVRTVNKTLIKEALKAGAEIQAAKLVRTTRLDIR